MWWLVMSKSSQKELSAMQELYQYAISYAKKAIENEKKGQKKAALDNYIKAVEILNKMIRWAPTPEQKEAYYRKAKTYLARAWEIRKELKKPGGEIGEEKGELSATIQDAIITERPMIKWDDVADLETAKQALREAIILPLLRPDLFKGARKPWRGVLLFGPPGCGKTLLAKAVASECDATFFNVSAATLVSKWLGESEKLVRELFKFSRKKQPSIVFFDEVDAIATTRGGTEHDAIRRVKLQLMQEMQGLATEVSEQIVVIGTTNVPWAIDPAFRRRFEKRILVPLPGKEAREQIFRIHTKDVELDESVVFNLLAEITEGFSGADIEIVCREAIMNPVREMDKSGLLKDKEAKIRPVTIEDFEKALQKIKPTVAPEELLGYEEWQQEFGSL